MTTLRVQSKDSKVVIKASSFSPKFGGFLVVAGCLPMMVGLHSLHSVTWWNEDFPTMLF